MCFKSVGEAAKASSRTNKDKEEVPEYPTREIVPVQGCSGCRRYSRWLSLAKYFCVMLNIFQSWDADVHVVASGFPCQSGNW